MAEEVGTVSEDTGKVKKESLYERTIDFIFSNDKRKYLILIILIGAILRFMVASNVSPLADEMVHAPHAINIIQSGVINEQNECPAWFYLTDISYWIFGVTAFSARFLSFFYGVFGILLIYLIAKELFNEKIAIMSAGLLALSAYVIRYTLVEMDISMTFFLLSAFYFFLIDVKHKKRIGYLPVVFLSVAILIKPIAATFIFSAALCFIAVVYKNLLGERKEFWKKNKKKIGGIIIIFLLFSMPVLAYNYILYKQKGLTDIIFTRFLANGLPGKIMSNFGLKFNQEIFSNLQGYNRGFEIGDVIRSTYYWHIKVTFGKYDPLLAIIGLLGILYIITREDEKYWYAKLFLFFHLIPFIFLSGTSLLATHFTTFIPMISMSAAVLIDWASNKFSHKINPKKFIAISFIIIAVVSLYMIRNELGGKSAHSKLREFAINEIGPNDVVVVDTRIYTGKTAWTFNDKAYVDSNMFGALMNMNNNLSGDKMTVNLFFVECIVDDCGWGTISQSPTINASAENLVSFFKNNTQLYKQLPCKGGYSEQTCEGENYFNIYKAPIYFSPKLYPAIYSSHQWFYYPVRWQSNDWYDRYEPKGVFQESFNDIGKLMLWIAVLIAIISPFYILRFSLKQK